MTERADDAQQRTAASQLAVPQHPLVVPKSGTLPEALGPLGAPQEMRRLADSGGLREMGVRPPLHDYLRQVWARRAFINSLGSARAYARNQGSYLGQLWSVLNPLLNALVYVLIFGLVMHSTRGMHNGVAFIVVGTFIYRFFDASVSAGSRSIKSNMSLVRSVHFPRASLPISTVITEGVTLLPALGVMCVIAWLSAFLPGQGDVPITWRLLLLPAAVALLWLFNTGAAFITARWVAVTPDVENVIPFVLRFVMYGSGVLFSIQGMVGHHTHLAWVLDHQPVAVFLYLARSAILNEPTIPVDPAMWMWGVGWALVTLVGGFLYFWASEARYGRD